MLETLNTKGANCQASKQFSIVRHGRVVIWPSVQYYASQRWCTITVEATNTDSVSSLSAALYLVTWFQNSKLSWSARRSGREHKDRAEVINGNPQQLQIPCSLTNRKFCKGPRRTDESGAKNCINCHGPCFENSWIQIWLWGWIFENFFQNKLTPALVVRVSSQWISSSELPISSLPTNSIAVTK